MPLGLLWLKQPCFAMIHIKQNLFSLASCPKLGSFLHSKLRASFLYPHPTALLTAALFEATFSDSGHWDFAILSATEVFCRTVIVHTWGPISETTVAERAGWVSQTLSRAVGSSLNAARETGFGAVTAAVLEGALALSAIAAICALGGYFL